MLNSLFQRKYFLSFLRQQRWIGILATIGMILLLLYKFITVPTPAIVTVDVTGIVREFIRSQSKLTLPPTILEQQVNTFSHQLETTLKSVAKERHVILMPQEAVIAGAIDLTPLIKARLNTKEFSSLNKAL